MNSTKPQAIIRDLYMLLDIVECRLSGTASGEDAEFIVGNTIKYINAIEAEKQEEPEDSNTFRVSHNRHPADRLGEARAYSWQVKQEIEDARRELLDNPFNLVGDEYAANIEHRDVFQADKEALIRDFGEDCKYLTKRVIPYVFSNKKKTARGRKN